MPLATCALVHKLRPCARHSARASSQVAKAPLTPVMVTRARQNGRHSRCTICTVASAAQHAMIRRGVVSPLLLRVDSHDVEAAVSPRDEQAWPFCTLTSCGVHTRSGTACACQCGCGMWRRRAPRSSLQRVRDASWRSQHFSLKGKSTYPYLATCERRREHL